MTELRRDLGTSLVVECNEQCNEYSFRSYSGKIPRAAGQLSPCTTTAEFELQSLRSATREATAMRSPHAATRETPPSCSQKKPECSKADPAQPKINAFFPKRRYLNAFALNQAVISNELKSSTPEPQKTQNALGTKTDRLGAEKLKKKKIQDFQQKRIQIFQDVWNLNSKLSSSSAAGGDRMGISAFFTKSTHDRCPRDSEGHHSTVGTEGQAKCSQSKDPHPLPTFTVLHASYTFLHHFDLLSLLGSVL